MNNEEIIGKTSGFLVTIGIFPYVYRIWQGKITANPVTWFIWFVAAFALLANYKSSGAKDNIWPAIFGCFNVTLVLGISLFKGKREPVGYLDWVCFFLAGVSLVAWFKLGKSREMSTYALYLAILADAFAVIPTFIMLVKKPHLDRPFAWLTFSIGYGITMFAITEHTIANYALPIYMTIMAALITTPLIVYRIKRKIPLREWI